MTAALDLVLRHNVWANRHLLAFCAKLDAAILDRATPGTYGTVRTTLQHIVSGEQFYITLLCGDRIGAEVDENVPRPFEELISIVTRTGERAGTLARDDDAERTVMVEGTPYRAGVIYAQLVHHGNEHRGQVKSILGANGLEPPGVSAWGFATDDAKTSAQAG